MSYIAKIIKNFHLKNELNFFLLLLSEKYTFSTPLSEDVMTGDSPSMPTPASAETSTLFGDFARDHYIPFVREHKRSWKTDERYLTSYILPYFASLPLNDITENTLANWLAELELSGLSKASCYRMFWLVKYMLNCACRWNILSSDEAFKHASYSRRTPLRPPLILSSEETLKLVHLLEEYHHRPGARAIHLILLTGANKSEILNARWENVDLQRGILVSPGAFTHRQRLIPLNSEAIKLIQTLPRQKGIPWLFFSSGGKRLSSLTYIWTLLRTRLGRPDLRIQDLRHSFAGFLVNMGIRQTELHSIMGHYMPQTLALVQNHTRANKEMV